LLGKFVRFENFILVRKADQKGRGQDGGTRSPKVLKEPIAWINLDSCNTMEKPL